MTKLINFITCCEVSVVKYIHCLLIKIKQFAGLQKQSPILTYNILFTRYLYGYNLIVLEIQDYTITIILSKDFKFQLFQGN